MPQNTRELAIWMLKRKLDSANAALAAFSCLKQALIEVPGARASVTGHWKRMVDVWCRREAAPTSLEQGLFEIESALASNAESLKEELAVWECGDIEVPEDGRHAGGHRSVEGVRLR